MTILILCLFIV